MAPSIRPATTSAERLVRFATAYDDAGTTPGDEGEGSITFELPEDLSELSDEDLAELREQAVEAFDAIYDNAEDLTDEDVAAAEALADAADAIRGEEGTRRQAREERAARAEELRERVRPTAEGEGDAEATDGEGEAEGSADDGEGAPEAEAEGEGAPEATDGEAAPEATAEAEREPAMAASSKRTGPLSITLSGVRRRQSSAQPREPEESRGATLVASSDLGASVGGTELDTRGLAEALSRKSAGIKEAAYRAAYRSGRRLTDSFGVATIRKEFPDELVASADNAMEVLNRAVDESRLPGGSLVASGGWCSPSETMYDLFAELESADGLVSVPEIGVSRGGIRYTRGPDFASLFANTGFSFTEAEDEAGEYGGLDAEGEPTAGEKPCFKVECEDFLEERLDVAGLCVTAGILQNRAYPELTERTIRGAMVAHQHRMAGNVIGAIAADSTAVAMPAGQVGALAPVLTAIELQVEHYRYVHRMGRGTTLEAIFPYWTRGAIRSDLSRRLGVPLENITNAVIGSHFAERGVNAQFVYNYQDLNGAAADATAWPEEVRFLLYAAGTWVRGSSDLVTLEAVFDSALFRVNDFTALFTEEGWLVARRGHDSREVTVPISATGHTAGGIEINHDGSAGGA